MFLSLVYPQQRAPLGESSRGSRAPRVTFARAPVGVLPASIFCHPSSEATVVQTLAAVVFGGGHRTTELGRLS